MYKKSPQGWLKHWDFILLDMISLQLAFIIAYLIRNGLSNPYSQKIYQNEAIIFMLCQLVIIFINQSFEEILKRGYYEEFVKTLRHVCLVMLLSLVPLFMTQQSEDFSRITYFITGAVYFVIAFLLRIARKQRLFKENANIEHKRSMILIARKEDVEQTIKRILSSPIQEFAITGIAFLGQSEAEGSISGIPVVGNINSVKDYLVREWVDEVFVKLSDDIPYPQKLIDDLIVMGITVHLSLGAVEKSLSGKKYTEKMGDYTVLTSSINVATPKQLLYKRMMDIAGGLVGCILTLILTVVIGPVIYLKSPGPIFFSQIRIGLNGKRFKIYKFRSMYMDAEERKKELMSQNKMDGLMFKMDYDPRIIGSEKRGKDGKPKGIGNFIRKTSLDEFPQFFNVLKGDMSLVGTRPPTVDEWEQYELHHRSRMSTKPGITGMWQVSGRSDITDFEEVVRLDTEYIENWSLGLDIKILLKTVVSVLKSEGSV